MSNLFKSQPIDNINILSNESTTKEEEKNFREYSVEFYEKQNYKVWNHTDDTGENDKGINIIAKKNKEILLIHCHLSTINVTTHDLKKFENQRNKFILENPLFEGYDINLRYSLTGFFLTEEAFWYIHEHSKIISYEVIK